MTPPKSARALVANPSPDDSPTLLTLAWCQLKSERGQCVRQNVLHRARNHARNCARQLTTPATAQVAP